MGVLSVFLTGALAVPLRADLGFGADALGAAVAAFFAASALGSAAMGRLVEAVGASRSKRAAAGVSTAALIGIALLARSWPALAGLLFAAGLANAGIHPSTHLFLSQEVSGRRQGLAFGVKQAAIPAVTLAGGLAAAVAGLVGGWRPVFAVAATAAVAAAVLVPGGAGSKRRRAVTPRVFVRGLILPAVAIGLGTASAVSFGAFLIDSSVEAGLGQAEAGALLAASSVAGLAGRVVAGWLADRRSGQHLRAVAAMLLTGACGFVLLATARAGWVFTAGALLAYGVGWAWPGVVVFAVVQAFPGAPAASTGVTQTGAFLGSATGPMLFGLVAAHGSYEAAWLLSAALAVAAAGAMLVSRSSLRARCGGPQPGRAGAGLRR